MKMRLAHKKDVPALARLETEAFSPELYHQMRRSQFAHLLTKGNADILLAEDEVSGRLMGSLIILYRNTSALARLYSIAVHPDFQGGEVGRNLFDAMEDHLKKKKLNGILLEIREDNQRHLTRYLGRGYQICGMVDDYYPDHAKCIKLKKVF